jgi:DNA-3-methyladenine glycosylase
VTGRILGPRFFHRPVTEVARDLLGAVVVSRIGGVVTSGRIVETEAYLGCEDPASHAWRGRRHAQNDGIYSLPGSWYVYRSYGVHWCANLVCAPHGLGAAVLLRALEPIEGIAAMIDRRGRAVLKDLCSGPGKLCKALGVAKPLDARPMWGSDVVVRSGRRIADAAVETTARVGITRAVDWPLRYLLRQR